MKRAQADLFASDIAVVAQGIQQFFERVEQDPDLHGKSLEEIVFLIQETGALDAIMPQVERIGEFIQRVTSGGWRH